MEERADVVIVGAGIAGIALSFELQKRGVSTILLDSRKSPDPTPRGITLQPNGLEALEKIGILDRVQQMGTDERILEIKDWNHNLLLFPRASARSLAGSQQVPAKASPDADRPVENRR